MRAISEQPYTVHLLYLSAISAVRYSTVGTWKETLTKA